MRKGLIGILSGIVVTLLLSLYSPGQSNRNKAEKYWVFFSDKGPESLRKGAALYEAARNHLTSRALRRRAKVRSQNELLDYTDLPLYSPYLEALKALNLKPIVESKWLNAVSVKMTSEQVETVKTLRFVRKVKKVAQFIRKPVPEQIPSPTLGPIPKMGDGYLDYGESYTQNAIMKVPDVHYLGINGTGVLVGMLDTGFNYQTHEALQKIHIIAEYDFINEDNITRNEEGQDFKFQHDHGTMTLSTIAGFRQGALIGPAYGANFILAKTEDIRSETHIEEDYWVAGIEWAESRGADVVSSSLGYNFFDDGTGYPFEQRDGNTAVTTIAADLAVKKGVVVVTAMGNEGNNEGSILTPADGDSVISVGAVYASGLLTSFSSIGPTADGRIKPDVVAMGAGVQTVVPNSVTKYAKESGTSFSTPLVASVAALILSAHPQLTPMQVRDALRRTADRASNPDNRYGWGLVNAYQAVLYHGTAFSNLPRIENVETGYRIKIKVASKVGINPDLVFLYYTLKQSDFTAVKLQQTAQSSEYAGIIPRQTPGIVVRLYFTATDLAGTIASYPYGAPGGDSLFSFITSDTTIYPPGNPVPKEYHLYQNYPNPFNRATIISYYLKEPQHVRLNIYNIKGQLVRTLINERQGAGPHDKPWNGKNQNGQDVVTGVYIYQLKSGPFVEAKKMLLLR